MFSKDLTTLIQCPQRKAGSYRIPSSVFNIGDLAFIACTNLTNVFIGDGVTNIGFGAFCSGSSLTNFLVSELNLYYSSKNGVIFDKNLTTLILCPAGKTGSYSIPDNITRIEFSAFSGCSHLERIIIPNTVTNIANDAFSFCSNLKSITIPDFVTCIGNSVFRFCISLKTITISTSVTKIDDSAFVACTNLTSIYFKGDAPVVDSDAFYGATNVTVYYRPGTKGWEPTFAGRPTKPWNP